MGVTGSGPHDALRLAHGLTGKNDQTPSVLAKLATSGKYTDKTTGTSAKFFTEVGAKIGLTVNQYTASASNIQLVLGNCASWPCSSRPEASPHRTRTGPW